VNLIFFHIWAGYQKDAGDCELISIRVTPKTLIKLVIYLLRLVLSIRAR